MGVCRLTLQLTGNQKLKYKREIVRAVTAKRRIKVNVAIAEIDDNDLWQKLSLGVCCVNNDSSHANSVISRVMNLIESMRGDAYVLGYHMEMTSGI